jgi:5-methylcytosine-specific restriction endonuclease McrA
VEKATTDQPILLKKKCSKCGTPRLPCEFHKRKRSGDGLYEWCKECVGAYYEENKSQINHKNKLRYAERRDAYLATKRAYREAHRLDLAAKGRAYRHANKQAISKKQLEHRRELADEERARRKEYGRAWRAAHPEVMKVSRKLSLDRRRYQVNGSYTAAEWRSKCEYWGWACYLCRKPLTTKTMHIEHRIPLSRGGADWLANVAPACAPCNLAKRTKTEAEFRAWRSPLLESSPSARED